ncbi:hypothetical protein AB0M38_21430 [Streptomyces sp. NPDC051742]|uniref:hypothetical protein n=1 Tax=unclassified Streptomyces TaxID=2593676 RepID=UPI0034182838
MFLIRGKRRGVDLACVLMATDLAANWYAVYAIQRGSFAAQQRVSAGSTARDGAQLAPTSVSGSDGRAPPYF